MRTLEELRRAITSATDMHSVVVSMKTLAAVTIRQFETAADATLRYEQNVERALQILLRGQPVRPETVRPPAKISDAGNSGLIVFGTDQGLCGRFNEETVAAVERFVNSTERNASPLAMAVGVRVIPALERLNVALTGSFHVASNASDITGLLQDMMPAVEAWQRLNHVQRIDVFFNRRTSSASYQPVRQVLLPMDRKYLGKLQQRDWDSRGLPVYRRPRQELLSDVVQQYLFLQLFRAAAESRASENASRIASMQQAEKNIEEKLARLQTNFNQQRQNSITEELVDIISGFQVATGQRTD